MIEIKNLSAGYGKKTVLENISLNIPKGKLMSVIGPNGSGKSTLIKAVAGIIEPFGGEIVIDSQNTAQISRKARARKIAYLSQGREPNFMTVGQTVLHGRFPYLSYPQKYGEDDRKAALTAMKMVGLPQKLWDEPLANLSGGMKQTVYIAMALAQSTDYIFLDEPTAYLDISHQVNLMKLMRELADGGKGILAVMHDLPLSFNFSDDVVVIDEGKVSLCGTPRELVSGNEIKNIFGVGLCYESEQKKYNYIY